jgi:hypothetical protein
MDPKRNRELPSEDPTVAEEKKPDHLRDSGAGARQYESGRNPHTQAQGSNRQGGGNPTQQGRNDR